MTTTHERSIREQQRSDLPQAAAPRLPFVSRLGRDVVVSIYARFLERFDVRLGIAAKTAASAPATASTADFSAAVADKYQLDLLFKIRHVGDVARADAAAAEK